MGLAEVLTIIFICAKIFGHSQISWLMCFLPVIIVYSFILLVMIIVGIIAYLANK